MRSSYRTPQIFDYGTVARLTQGQLGSGKDGGLRPNQKPPRRTGGGGGSQCNPNGPLPHGQAGGPGQPLPSFCY